MSLGEEQRSHTAPASGLLSAWSHGHHQCWASSLCTSRLLPITQLSSSHRCCALPKTFVHCQVAAFSSWRISELGEPVPANPDMVSGQDAAQLPAMPPKHWPFSWHPKLCSSSLAAGVERRFLARLNPTRAFGALSFVGLLHRSVHKHWFGLCSWGRARGGHGSTSAPTLRQRRGCCQALESAEPRQALLSIPQSMAIRGLEMTASFFSPQFPPRAGCGEEGAHSGLAIIQSRDGKSLSCGRWVV